MARSRQRHPRTLVLRSPGMERVRPEPRTSQFAIASIVCGLLCITGLGVAALPLGLVARKQISREPERFKGKGLANTGIVLGVLYLVGAAIVVLAFVGSIVSCNGTWPDGCV